MRSSGGARGRQVPEPYRLQDLEERRQEELRLGIEPLRPLLCSRLSVHPGLHEEAGLLGSIYA